MLITLLDVLLYNTVNLYGADLGINSYLLLVFTTANIYLNFVFKMFILAQIFLNQM